MDPGLTMVMCAVLLTKMVTIAEFNETDYEEELDSVEPVFLSSVDNITVREGGLAILPCSVQNLGTRQVAWRRLDNDHFLTIGTLTWVKDLNIQVEHRILGDISIWDLLIKHVRTDHEGLYECQVTSVNRYVRHIALHVQAIVVKGRQLVEKGDELKLVCNTTGKFRMPDDVNWYKDGQPINSSRFSHVVVTNYRSLGSRTLVSVLSVNRSRTSDSGEYICRSSLAEIDSINVTVQTADMPNVKRGIQGVQGVFRPISKLSNSVPTSYSLQYNICFVIISFVVR
ncbi:hemicentin-2 [Patella vulgata]|uniref:hemicentin-2 n=1 Tax=Patella vulgata TaxID=6465 RepID=UPI0021801308|nr:hemicentin-2 [Patella vulgata]